MMLRCYTSGSFPCSHMCRHGSTFGMTPACAPCVEAPQHKPAQARLLMSSLPFVDYMNGWPHAWLPTASKLQLGSDVLSLTHQSMHVHLSKCPVICYPLKGKKKGKNPKAQYTHMYIAMQWCKEVAARRTEVFSSF
jgi:hypothetical protein